MSAERQVLRASPRNRSDPTSIDSDVDLPVIDAA